MSDQTKIGWVRNSDGTAGSTFNPWLGCRKVSPGCDHCYAESWAKRSGLVTWGEGMPRMQTSESYQRKPFRWNEDAAKKGIRHRVFCASLADVFDEEVPDEWRDELFAMIAMTPHLDWLLLTKRPAEMVRWFTTSPNPAELPDRKAVIEETMRTEYATNDQWSVGWLDWPLPNVWLGVTAEDQPRAEERIPFLLATPAAKRFVSIEPHLELVRPELDGIDWIICGCESGPHAREQKIEWRRSLRDQCQAAGVAFFDKQAMIDGRLVKEPELDGEHWQQVPS